MLFSEFLQLLAVLLEIAVMAMGVAIATRQKRSYGWCIAFTFGLFILFDIGRLYALPVPEAAHALIFLVACGSMLFGAWLLYRDNAALAIPQK